ncbi:hypothetical protein [[Eubacterium] cellulosolvens]
MSGRVELFVGRGIDGDQGIVRLDDPTRQYLNVELGDEVYISSLSLSIAQAKAKVDKALKGDEGTSIVRVADDKIKEGNFRVGMRVLVGNTL